MPVELKGMTWAHSRGYSSIVAVSQRFEELHPDIKLIWEKRSLADFENQPVGYLAERYDMLILDHPWMGFGAASGVLHHLEQLLPPAFLADQAAHSTGASFQSYTMDGHQLALPIDAATPIAIYRQDLMERPDHSLPKTWAELLQLAKQGGVIVAAAPLYTLIDFFMLCSTIVGDTDELYRDEIAPAAVMREALEQQREVLSHCDPIVFNINPIQLYEIMSGDQNRYTYCPFVYGYSNYCRPGYSPHRLKAADVVTYQGRMLRTILGGTGLAVSSRCKHLSEVAAFCQYALSEEIQKTVYFDAGGQPGYRTAWLDPAVNRRSNGFFQDTLATIEHAAMRPRYNGYLHLQDNGGALLREYLMSGRDLSGTVERLNALYRASRAPRCAHENA
ncbi:extracellular solute-binding protein [uncultured Oscillibacter sp.]|uniref:extracellular solute-binding protein n=1 Tax=uncultured Oscillibacter sp. TaxID=876091 RepID=UPI002804D5D4|nr:extracellular solute-binding protein [uncultured Oscillibacter sp.]